LGDAPGDRFGQTLLRCPDLTGDDVADWLVGAPTLSGPGDGSLPEVPDLAGGVYFLPSEALADKEGRHRARDLGTLWWGASSAERAGTSATCDQDLDGDATPDLMIGSPWHGAADAGAVYVISGGALPPSGPLDDVASRVLVGPYSRGWFGAALAAADLDADGHA